MRPWVVKTVDAIAAAAVVPAVIVAVLFWSIVPFLIFLVVIVSAYGLAYWGMPHLLQAKRGGT